jgi:competence protein ComEC
MTLLYMAIAWAAGITLASLAAAIFPLWWALAASGAGMAILTRRDRLRRTLGLCIFTLGLGIGRYAAVQPTITADHVAHYNDQGYASIIGVIDEPPDVRDNAIRLKVRAQRFVRREVQRPVEGYMLAYADRLGTYQYGDLVRVNGLPQTPPVFDTFAWRDFLARQGVHTIVTRAQVTVLRTDQGQPALAALYSLRTRAKRVIEQVLPSPASDFLAGVLLGDDSGLSPDVKTAFQLTGTSHLIAISGANIAVVIGLLLALFSTFTGRKAAMTFTVAGVAVYTVFVGASPAVVRAALMGSLAFLAERLGRQSDGLTSLAASAWVMTIFNPFLLFDAGLILSIAGTVGLILYVKPIEQFSHHFLNKLFTSERAQRAARLLLDSALMTFAAQITVLPVVFIFFDQFSLVSFIVNIVVVPAQALVMALGLAVVLAGSIWLPLGQLLAWVVALPIQYTLALIRSTAATPGIHVQTDVSVGAASVYYAVLFAATFALSAPPAQRKTLIERVRASFTVSTAIIVGAVVTALVWIAVLSRPDGKLHVHFLAVGEGSAILIQTPHGAAILIDGGENPTRLHTALGDRLPFFRREIDLLVVTQMHRSTITALPSLLERYPVSTVLTSGHAPETPEYEALAAAFESQQVRVVAVTAGYRLQTDDGVSLDIFAPEQTPPLGAKPQDVPMVMRVRYGDATFLIAPEASEKAMRSLLTGKQNLQSVVVQLPSNGDDRVNTPEWFKATTPQAVIVVAELGDFSAQPDEVVLTERAKGIPAFRTDLHGPIEVATDGHTLWVHQAKP